MGKLNLIAYGVLASLILSGASFFYGKFEGRAAQRADHEIARQATQQELFDLGEALSMKAAEIETLQRERAQYVQEIENQALDSVGSSNPGISPGGGLRRLELRWGTP
jgi:cob(I)alamin adenosyltransferase